MLPLAEFRAREAEVPNAPGVYQIWGPDGQLLYVGVAGRSGAKGSSGRSGLRDRLDSHFCAGPSRGFADYVLRMVLGITLSQAELTALTQEFIRRCTATWEVTPDYRTAVTREAHVRRTAAPLLNPAPLITSAQGRALLTEYIATQRPGARLQQLLEDASDYGAQLSMVDDAPWPIGWAFLFVSKSTGQLREVAPGDGIDKLSAMEPAIEP